MTRWEDQTKNTFLITRFMGPTWGASGADRTQMGPMLAPWSLLSGYCNPGMGCLLCTFEEIMDQLCTNGIHFISVTPHEHHGISNRWQHDWLFNSLLKLTAKKTKTLHHWHLWVESTSDWWFPSDRVNKAESVSIASCHHDISVPLVWSSLMNCTVQAADYFKNSFCNNQN